MYSFEICDFSNPDHLKALIELLEGYMADPMGDHPAHTKLEQLRLVDGLASHPTAFVLFVLDGDRAVGMATCFELFSTFAVKRFINVHDLVVTSTQRGKGAGRALLNHIIEMAREKDFCKVSLEVRTYNAVAQGLYRDLVFGEADPDMLFWVKKV